MSEKVPSDHDLIAGCINGRKESWDTFVERFSGLIYWGIHKTLEGSAFQERKGLPDEIFQDIFEKLLERAQLKKLRDLKGIRKYLSVMACHTALDRMKSLSSFEKKHVDVDAFVLDPSEEALQDQPPPPESKERDLVIGGLLESLSPKERSCVEFYYLDEKTHREIGEILGMPQDTVSTIIRRTREKLKARFTERGIEP